MKKFTLSLVTFFLFVILLFALLFLFQPAWLASGLESFFPGALYAVETQEKVVALTIDDGPDPLTTPKIMDILEEKDARATFFIITDNVDGNGELITQLLAAGHELGNHSVVDEISINLDEQEFKRKVALADGVLGQYTQPVWFRPGSGFFSQEMLDIVEAYGYQTALGSVHPLDPQIPSAAFAAWYLLQNIQPGSIIILHDCDERGERTAEVLAEVLPELRHRGYQVVTLSELVTIAGNSE